MWLCPPSSRSFKITMSSRSLAVRSGGTRYIVVLSVSFTRSSNHSHAPKKFFKRGYYVFLLPSNHYRLPSPIPSPEGWVMSVAFLAFGALCKAWVSGYLIDNFQAILPPFIMAKVGTRELPSPADFSGLLTAIGSLQFFLSSPHFARQIFNTTV